MNDDVTIYVDVQTASSIQLTPEEAFPDGVPDEITPAAIIAGMKESGTVLECVRNWGLDEDLELVVTVRTDRGHIPGSQSTTWGDRG